MYPPELLDTVDSADASGVRKRRKLELSKVNALPNAEEAFGMPAIEGDDEGVPVDGKHILERLDALRDDEGDDVGEAEDDEGLEEEEEDEVYDDEDAGDYDAEGYFDNGDEGGDDYGDDGDGEGTY